MIALDDEFGRHVRMRSCAHVLAAVGLLGFAGCSDLTRVTHGDSTTPTQFDSPTGALARRAGAVYAFTQGVGEQVLSVGLLTDELTDSHGASSYADRRIVDASANINGAGYPYHDLSVARLQALRAIQSLRQYPAAAQSRVGELFAYVAYVETMFAENLCNGVPIGEIVNGEPMTGPTLNRSQLMARAVADFDSALANVSDTTNAPDSSIVYLALVGKARLLADSGGLAAANAMAAIVPTTYLYQVQYGGGNLFNLAAQNFGTPSSLAGSVSVSDREGINGLDFGSAVDPRVPIDTISNFGPEANQTGHNFLPFFGQPQAPIVLASGTEARLIEAEAALNMGDVAGWTARLNALRLGHSDTTLSHHPLSPDSTTTALPDFRVSVMFRERAFWLFLTGHRQGEMRRLLRQYGRPIESVFPTGNYVGAPGTSYGTAVTFVPYGEQGNPNFRGCVDRAG